MDVYLLYFTLHGLDPNGFTSWGAILVEDGEMESFVGSGSTEFEALLDGLTKCLEQIPSTLPLVIRSKHRTVLQLGRRWLDTWRSDGWDSEVHSTLVSALMDTLENKRVEWFSPSYLDHLDKTVGEYALEEWNLQQDSLNSDDAREEVDSVEDFDEENEISLEEPMRDEAVDQDCSIESATQNPSPSEPKEGTNTEEDASNLNQDTPFLSDELIPSESKSAKTEQLSDSHSTSTVSTTSENNLLQINPDDQAQYPYVDDDGWQQLYTLFDPPFHELEQRPPSRIVAYVTARHHKDLAAWSFALIDKPSQIAFFKAVGHRHSTLNRSLLQGCIELLSTLKNAAHHVECRLDNIELTRLVQRLIANPNTHIEDEIWMQESAFVSQLSYWIEQRSVTVEYIDDDTPDLARQMVQNFSRERLDALNYGEAAEFSLRRSRFPLERLMD